MRVSALWRHPIKGHGVEAVVSAPLRAGRTFPWDRVWAIAHDAAKVAPGDRDWAECVNFSRGAKTSALMAIRAVVDEQAGFVSLSHPDLPDLRVNPDLAEDAARLVDWARSLCDPGRAMPVFVARAERGMTDSDWPSVAILSRESLSALAAAMGQELEMERFRGNIWLEGLEPWAEFGWVGREIRIGTAVLRVRERITRCKATTVDPATGQVRGDTLAALHAHWGHRDFGVYAEVVADGVVSVGDPAGLVEPGTE